MNSKNIFKPHKINLVWRKCNELQQWKNTRSSSKLTK